LFGCDSSDLAQKLSRKIGGHGKTEVQVLGTCFKTEIKTKGKKDIGITNEIKTFKNGAKAGGRRRGSTTTFY
jgi:hypothetical protein